MDRELIIIAIGIIVLSISVSFLQRSCITEIEKNGLKSTVYEIWEGKNISK